MAFFNVYTCLYHVFIAIYSFFVNAFYHTVECDGLENFPISGKPTLLLANHGNSMVDALLLVTKSYPKDKSFTRIIRMTAKDKLWSQKFFGIFCRIMNAVPFKRRQDYSGSSQNNDDAFSAIFDGLEAGDCICVFPEGISRYNSQLAPIKTGAARIAHAVMKRNARNPSFELNVVTVGLTYLHREKFRSNVFMEYAKPIVLTTSSFQKESKPEFLATLTRQIDTQLRNSTLDAPDWQTLQISKLAAGIFAPYGTAITFKEHIKTTDAFIKLLDNPPTHCTKKEHDDLRHSLINYHKLLRLVGLKDARIRQPIYTNGQIITRIFKCLLIIFVFFWLSLPACLSVLPMLLYSKIKENSILLQGIENNMDEVTLYKISTAFIYFPTLLFVYSIVTLPILPISIPAFLVFFWISIHSLEELMAGIRSLNSLLKLLLIADDCMEDLKRERDDLENRINNVSEKYNITKPIPSSEKASFSIFKRTKKDYGEVLRPWDVNYNKKDKVQ